MTGIAPKDREEYERLNAPINKRFKSVHEIEKNGRTFGYILLAIELLFLGGCLVGQYINALNNAKNDPTINVVVGIVFIMHTIAVYAIGVGTTNSYRSQQREFEMLNEQEKKKREVNSNARWQTIITRRFSRQTKG